MPSPEAIIALGERPIADDMPGGESARYEPEFELLEAEISKLGSLSGGQVQWPVVIQQAGQLLFEKSKDLLVAVYFAYGQLEIEGFGGFLHGLRMIHGMCANFWEQMHPKLKRLRGREQAFAWLVERVEGYIAEHRPFVAGDREPLEACLSVLEELMNAVEERMAEVGGSGLHPLYRQLRGLVEEMDMASAPVVEQQATTDTTGAAPAAGIAQVQQAPPLDTRVHIQSREEAFRRLREVQEFFLKAEPHSPIGHMLGRIIAWEQMDYVQLYSELLRNARDGRAYLWDALNVDPENEQ